MSSNNSSRSLKDIETYMQMKKTKLSLSSLSSSSSTQLWSFLPEEIIIYDILLKLPVYTLLRLRCVSRYFHSLITNPSFVRKHIDHSTVQPNLNLLLLDTSSKVYRLYTEVVFKNFTTDGVDDPSLYLNQNVAEMRSPFESAIRSSCNGLLILDGKHRKNAGYVWNPCTKEYKELPLPSMTEQHRVETSSNKFKLTMSSSSFCGFGYDRTNYEYKVLYHENRFGKQNGHDLVSDTEFKLYTLGRDTWTSISNNMYRSLFFEEIGKRIGLFVNGALYWIMLSNRHEWKAKIISFDMEKEEFREIQKPRLNEEENYFRAIKWQLQVLQGCLCLCEFPKSPKIGFIKRADVWMLKDYHVKDSWTKLFTIVWPDSLSTRYLRLLRFCENGEIILRRDRYNLLVYNPVNQKARHVENRDKSFLNAWENEMIYKESLVSLNSGTYSI